MAFQLRRNSKSQDLKLAKKTKTSRVVATTVKSSDNLSVRIANIKANVEANLGKYKDDYLIIADKSVLHDYITECIGNGYISIDTETDGLDPLQNKLAGICIYSYNQKGAYIPINHISYITKELSANQLQLDFVVSEFDRLLKKNPQIDMFNAKFDIRFLRANGLNDIYCTWDGYLASQLLNENEPTHGLKALHNKYVLNNQGDAFKFDDLFKGIPFTMIPYNVGYLYAAHDPVITTELCDYQRPYLTVGTELNKKYELEDVAWVFHNIEMPCLSVVADIEDNGVKFDLDYCHELSVKYSNLLKEKEQTFYDACGEYSAKISAYRKKHADCKLDEPINIGSPTQIAILLYDVLKIEPVDIKSPRGTGEAILQKINIPITQSILEYREVSKLLSTYIDKLPDCVNPNDGRVHCSFNQYGARTGRFSSSDPNLQNIPSHNKDIRKMFVASDGYVLMSSDYSQQEPKVMTQMCGDKKMIKAYQEGKDLYAEIAALSFNTTYENCLEFRPDGTTNPDGKNRRSQAKSILLGVLYGRGVPSIAEQLGTTTKKAQAIKDSVFKGFPAIPKFESDSLDMGFEKGYVTTLWGRKRRLPDLQIAEYEFKWTNGASVSEDPLDFSGINEPIVDDVPDDIQDYYLKKLSSCNWKDKSKIFKQANEEGIWIIDNGAKIADAQRQCVNARIQGSAADMSKLAMILVGNDKRLKELGFRLLIPVHDELIAECPEEYVEECSKRFAELMSKAAESKLTIPIKCDVEITKCWYGEPVIGSVKQKETSVAREFENELIGHTNNWVGQAQKERRKNK